MFTDSRSCVSPKDGIYALPLRTMIWAISNDIAHFWFASGSNAPPSTGQVIQDATRLLLAPPIQRIPNSMHV